MKPRLERWLQHGNTLVGYLFDSKEHPLGTRVMTGAIVELDPLSFEARCVDGDYKLGEPGTYQEHCQDDIGSIK